MRGQGVIGICLPYPSPTNACHIQVLPSLQVGGWVGLGAVQPPFKKSRVIFFVGGSPDTGGGGLAPWAPHLSGRGELTPSGVTRTGASPRQVLFPLSAPPLPACVYLCVCAQGGFSASAYVCDFHSAAWCGSRFLALNLYLFVRDSGNGPTCLALGNPLLAPATAGAPRPGNAHQERPV